MKVKVSGIFLSLDVFVRTISQGNMDPGVLFGSKDVIEQRVLDTIRRAKSQGVRHIMNLGHGVLPGTPEDNVAHYFEVARTAHQRL